MILKKIIIFSLTFIVGGSSIVNAVLQDRDEAQGLQLRRTLTKDDKMKRKEEKNIFSQEIIKKAQERAQEIANEAMRSRAEVTASYKIMNTGS